MFNLQHPNKKQISKDNFYVTTTVNTLNRYFQSFYIPSLTSIINLSDKKSLKRNLLWNKYLSYWELPSVGKNQFSVGIKCLNFHIERVF